MTAGQARRLTQNRLELGGIESARFESRVLLETVLGLDSGTFLLPETVLSPQQEQMLASLTTRRCAGEPLQYLCGEWEFFGLPFAVGEGVLIPRQDTETLVETVLQVRRGTAQTRLLDLCSGSGCIPAAISVHLHQVTGCCMELSEKAMGFLRQNLARHAPQLRVVAGDVRAPDAAFLRACENHFDVITCNPPYLTAEDMQHLQREVAYEPALALYGGEDGLEFYRRLIPLWMHCLVQGGVMVFEVGAGQAVDVCRIMTQEGLVDCHSVQDDTGIARVVTAAKPA